MPILLRAYTGGIESWQDTLFKSSLKQVFYGLAIAGDSDWVPQQVHILYMTLRGNYSASICERYHQVPRSSCAPPTKPKTKKKIRKQKKNKHGRAHGKETRLVNLVHPSSHSLTDRFCALSRNGAAFVLSTPKAQKSLLPIEFATSSLYWVLLNTPRRLFHT